MLVELEHSLFVEVDTHRYPTSHARHQFIDRVPSASCTRPGATRPGVAPSIAG